MCLAFGSHKLSPRGFLLFRRVCPFSPVFRQHRGVSVAGLCYTQKLPAPSRFQTRTLKTIRSKKRKEPRDLLPTTAGESKLDPQPTPNGPSPDRAATPRVRKLLSNGLTGGPEEKKAGATDPWRCKMAREKEMQEFTRSLFRGRPDLSTLTHSIVRRRFLAHAGRDHLEPEEKQALKRLVEDELLKMQVDEEGAREEGLHRAKKAKRPPTTPCRDPRRKRPRFNSESELSSAASSPDCSSPPAEKGMAAAGSLKESPKRASKKAVESIDEEGQQRDLTAKTGLEEAMAKNGEEKEEGSARASKAWKEESSEEEEEGKGSKGSIRRKPVTKNKQAPGRTSPSRVQSMEVSEGSEEEPVQRTGRKGAESHQESEKESEEEEMLVKKKESREEEEACKPRAQSNGREKSAWKKRNAKQKSRAARLQGDGGHQEGEEDTAAAGSGEDSEGDDEPLGQRKSKDRTQGEADKRQSGSSKYQEDSGRRLKPTTKGTGKTAQVESEKIGSGEASDSEREVSDSEAGGSPQGDRKSRSSRKSSKKSRTYSSSSSADSSPELRGRKAGGSDRCGEDHPAVRRLKRYIRACGAHRNYKKLLGPCRSRKECLSILRAELEALGMKGNPSLEKCRTLKLQREEAAEVASLDMSNIISGSGRPRRCTAWNPSEAAAPGELYRRTLDSEEEWPRRLPPDWSHMRGIISSDGESN